MFTWYATLPRKSILSWQEMEKHFRTQFFDAELKVCIEKLSTMNRKSGKTIDLFVSRFKKIITRCKIHLLKTEYVKMAIGLDTELRKKFHGMEFKDFYDLAAKDTKYEEQLKEEK